MTATNWENVFDSGSVVYELESTEKLRAIRELVHRAQVFRRIEGLDLTDFAETVIERERVQSTGLGHGVAVAHGRTPHVAHSKIALGVSWSGIEYDSLDGAPVHLLFIVANHPEQQTDYLQVLSHLVTLLRDGQFRGELFGCMSPDELQTKLSTAFYRRAREQQLSSEEEAERSSAAVNG